jgi:hypothetical protein
MMPTKNEARCPAGLLHLAKTGWFKWNIDYISLAGNNMAKFVILNEPVNLLRRSDALFSNRLVRVFIRSVLEIFGSILCW